MKKLIPLIALLLPAFASADVNPWLKDDKPEEMYATAIGAEGCPHSESEIEEILHGLLIRSRIKPSAEWNSGEVLLTVRLRGIEDSGLYTYSLEVELARWHVVFGAIISTTIMGDDYGSYGRDTKSGITRIVKESAENALTDYMKANFDLGED